VFFGALAILAACSQPPGQPAPSAAAPTLEPDAGGCYFPKENAGDGLRTTGLSVPSVSPYGCCLEGKCCEPFCAYADSIDSTVLTDPASFSSSDGLRLAPTSATCRNQGAAAFQAPIAMATVLGYDYAAYDGAVDPWQGFVVKYNRLGIGDFFANATLAQGALGAVTRDPRFTGSGGIDCAQSSYDAATSPVLAVTPNAGTLLSWWPEPGNWDWWGQPSGNPVTLAMRAARTRLLSYWNANKTTSLATVLVVSDFPSSCGDSLTVLNNQAWANVWGTGSGANPRIETDVIVANNDYFGAGYNYQYDIVRRNGWGALYTYGNSSNAYVQSQAQSAMFFMRKQVAVDRYVVNPPASGELIDLTTLKFYLTIDGVEREVPNAGALIGCGNTQPGYYATQPEGASGRLVINLCPVSSGQAAAGSTISARVVYDCEKVVSAKATWVRPYSFDMTRCPATQSPTPTRMEWNADLPSNSWIEFRLALSPTVDGAQTAPVNYRWYAQGWVPTSANGYVFLPALPTLNAVPADARWARLEVDLNASSDLKYSPVLRDYAFKFTCGAACVPTTCAAQGKNCGSIDDGCGSTLFCGTCSGTGVTCGGGGTANVCGCTPQTVAQLCDYRNCGTYTATDNCGQSRTVSCGTCSGPGVSCAGTGLANVCGCPAATDVQLCAAAGAECGSLVTTDNCGTVRTVPKCGDCALTNATPVCTASNKCAIGVCNATWGNCNAVTGDGCETTLLSLTNCGTCGSACNPQNVSGATCATGACDYGACNVGFAECDGVRANGCERNIRTNSDCGACGAVCARNNAVTSCSTGACQFVSCNAGWVNLDGDPNNGCEFACTFLSSTDEPDDSFTDANCDGLDGDVARSIFVAPGGNDANPGTRAQPKATIQGGIDAASASTKPYVLVSGGTYTQNLTLKNGVSIFGGYSAPNGWARNASAAGVVTINGAGSASSAVVAVAGTNLTSYTVVDRVTVNAANASAASATSIGLSCSGCSGLWVRRATIRSGNGGSGAAGTAGAGGSNGGGGSGRTGGTSPVGFSGGTGGAGANARTGGSGARGVPTSGSSLGGAGGVGGIHGYSSGFGVCWESRTASPGGDGQAGVNGSQGANGAGGSGATTSGFSFVGGAGSSGTAGAHGTGGGGGGAGGGYDGCYQDSTGGNGGGGGGGASAGTGAVGGSGGGASVAVFLIDSSGARIDNSALVSANGGAGGAGGSGGPGGSGGTGAGGASGSGNSSDWRRGGSGGRGGNGGRGGHGGGGAGGASFALFRVNSSATVASTTLTAGAGGAGGASSGNAGAAGASAANGGTP
jgi:hypothetical protein